jgi:predicted PurR-regulated permease PerM
MPTPDTDRQRLNSLIFYAAVILLGYLAYCIAKPFLVPLAWAGILTLCVLPLHRRLAPRIGPGKSAGILTLLVALVLIIPAVFFAITLVGEASQATDGIQSALDTARNSERLQNTWTWAQTHLPLPSIDEIKARVPAIAGKVTAILAGQAGAILQNIATFIFMLLVTLIALFFFLKDSENIGKVVRSILPFEEARKVRLIDQARELIYASVITMLSVASAQGLAGGIIFAALGLEAPVFWGLVMAICAFIPLVGTSIVWAPAAMWLFFHGSWVKGLILALCGVFIIGGMDNILRPLLMTGRTSMPLLLMLVSLLGGLVTFGFIGLVLGPVVMATVVSLLSIDIQNDSKV